MREVIQVLSHGMQWKVQCEHCKQSEIVSTQAEAIQVAKRHVSSLAPGTLAQILVQGSGGQYRTEWTYGKDPFAPAG